MDTAESLPGLLRCPPEIHEMIFRHVQSYSDKYNLVLVCRQVQPQAERVLYEDIETSFDFNNPSAIEPSMSLLRKLLSRADLAACIRSVEICESPSNGWDRPARAPTVGFWTNAEVQRLTATFGDVVPGMKDAVPFALTHASLQTLAALLIVITPNLTTLSLTMEPDNMFDVGFLPALFMSVTARQRQVLRSLDHMDLSLMNNEFKDSYGLEGIDLRTLWAIPTLQSLCVTGSCLNRMPDLGLHISHLTHLRLCGIFDSVIEDFLAASPLLEEFSYEYHDFDRVNTSFPHLLGPHLVAGLQSSSRTLRRLKVSVTDYNPRDSGYQELGADEVFSSFRDFKQLKDLELPMLTLLGESAPDAPRVVDVVPDQLERLYLRADINDTIHFDWLPEDVSTFASDYMACVATELLPLKYLAMPAIASPLIREDIEAFEALSTEQTVCKLVLKGGETAKLDDGEARSVIEDVEHNEIGEDNGDNEDSGDEEMI